MTKDFDELAKEFASDLPWQQRLIYITEPDFSDEEVREISHHAAMDLLTASELRTLVILFAEGARR